MRLDRAVWYAISLRDRLGGSLAESLLFVVSGHCARGSHSDPSALASYYCWPHCGLAVAWTNHGGSIALGLESTGSIAPLLWRIHPSIHPSHTANHGTKMMRLGAGSKSGGGGGGGGLHSLTQCIRSTTHRVRALRRLTLALASGLLLALLLFLLLSSSSSSPSRPAKQQQHMANLQQPNQQQQQQHAEQHEADAAAAVEVAATSLRKTRQLEPDQSLPALVDDVPPSTAAASSPSSSSSSLSSSAAMWLHEQLFFCSVSSFLSLKETSEKVVYLGESLSWLMLLLPFGRDIVSTEIHSQRGWDTAKTIQMLRIMQGHPPPRNYTPIPVYAPPGSTASSSGSSGESHRFVRTGDGLMGAEESGRLFVDVGANVGWFTLAMGAAGYRVASFEPLQHNALALRSSLCRNAPAMPPDRVRFYPLGLGAHAATCAVYSDSRNVGDGHMLCRSDRELQEAKRLTALRDAQARKLAAIAAKAQAAAEAAAAPPRVLTPDEQIRRERIETAFRNRFGKTDTNTGATANTTTTTTTTQQQQQQRQQQPSQRASTRRRRLLSKQQQQQRGQGAEAEVEGGHDDVESADLDAPSQDRPAVGDGPESEAPATTSEALASVPSSSVSPSPAHDHDHARALGSRPHRRKKISMLGTSGAEETVARALSERATKEAAKEGRSGLGSSAATVAAAAASARLLGARLPEALLLSARDLSADAVVAHNSAAAEEAHIDIDGDSASAPSSSASPSSAAAAAAASPTVASSSSASSVSLATPAAPLSATAEVRLRSLGMTREWNSTGLVPGGHFVRNEVRLERLDGVLRGQHIHLLKLDVEGFELQVLRGATALFDNNRVTFVVAEYAPYMLARAEASVASATAAAMAAAAGTGVDNSSSKPGVPSDMLRFFHDRGYEIRHIRQGFNIDRVVREEEFERFCTPEPAAAPAQAPPASPPEDKLGDLSTLRSPPPPPPRSANRQCEIFMCKPGHMEQARHEKML